MSKSPFFSDADRALIAGAVGVAESRTSGEIVPVIVPRSSDYSVVGWKSAMAGAFLGLVGYELYVFQYAGWTGDSWLDVLGISVFLVLGIVSSLLASTFVEGYERLLIGRAAMDAAVHQRAMKAFVNHEVFSTRDRTGIVLLVSLFEHRVEVFGDSGINEIVKPEDWAEVVSQIIMGIKAKDATGGLVKGIEACGSLLEHAGVHIKVDDTDELSNQPRFEE